jgi:hypothetical protein
MQPLLTPTIQPQYPASASSITMFPHAHHGGPAICPTPSQLNSVLPSPTLGKTPTIVDAKAWPAFDGTGPLEPFLTKVEFLMNLSGMTDGDRMGILITLIKGRAFAWLAI